MPYEKQDDTGYLFRNANKTKDAQPDYTGWIKQGGKERRLAAWIKDMKDGSKALSIKVSDKQDKPGTGGKKGGMSHDIPF
jgi:hypothetical protein|tara:strand:+ start:538 stop:777 length:240 start_codon:yes stop_codon:yes gene_type:complete